MNRGLASAIGLILAASCAGAEGGGDWPTFHHDAGRRGATPAAFTTCAFDEAWRFNLGDHTWRYQKGTSVWSASPAIAQVESRPLLFIGAYDHNLYALDARDGAEVWRLTTGGRLNAPPAVAHAGDRTLVYIGSGDRVFYAADAATGDKVWSYETMPWSYTVGISDPTSPLVTDIGGQTLAFVGFWNSDRRAVRSVQRGDLFAFDAASGEKLWERTLTDNPLTSPALAQVDGTPLLVVGSEDGCVYAVEAATGEVRWTFVGGHSVTAAPMVAKIGEQPAVFVGNSWGMLNCLSARTGAVLWSVKTGHEIKSTPAIAQVEGRPRLFVGSSDRYMYCVDAKTSRVLWRFQTGKYVVSSPVVADVAGKPAVLFSALDDRLYVRDALSGQQIWTFETGEMLWPYETRGSSLWSSPAVAAVEGTSLLFFGSYDGNLYAYKAVPKCWTGDATPPPGRQGMAQAATPDRSSAAVFVPPLLGLGLIASSFALVIGARRKRGDGDPGRG